MNKFLSVLVLILCSAFLISCASKKTEVTQKTDSTTSKKTDEPPKTKGQLAFTNKELVKSYKNCVPETDSCSYIRLKYIEATDGKAKDKINTVIQKELLLAYDMPDQHYKTPQEMMDVFLRDYETTSKQMPKFRQDWAVDLNIEKYTETDRIICISCDFYSFLGGAHPTGLSAYFNFDKETGDTISLSNLFKPGFEPKLNALIDKKFREINDLKPGDNLVEKGGLFENVIKFNYNFAITKDSLTNEKGLEFLYNEYEIAPYAAGPIELDFTSAELADILAPNDYLK